MKLVSKFCLPNLNVILPNAIKWEDKNFVLDTEKFS